MRHSCTLLLLLVLGFSVHAAHAMCTAASAPALAEEMSLPNNCNGCGEQSDNAPACLCGVVCPGSAACTLFIPAVTQLNIVYAAEPVASLSTLHEDWLRPLDPFPPKRSV